MALLVAVFAAASGSCGLSGRGGSDRTTYLNLEGSAASFDQVKVVYARGSVVPNQDGSFVADFAKGKLRFSFVTNAKTGVPFMLGYALPEGTSSQVLSRFIVHPGVPQEINAETTALGYIALAPVFWGWGQESKVRMLERAVQDPRFAQLTAGVRQSLRASAYHALLGEENPQLQLAFLIASDAQDQYRGELLQSGGALAPRTPYAPDQGLPFLSAMSGTSLTFTNSKMLPYAAGIYKVDRSSSTPFDLTQTIDNGVLGSGFLGQGVQTIGAKTYAVGLCLQWPPFCTTQDTTFSIPDTSNTYLIALFRGLEMDLPLVANPNDLSTAFQGYSVLGIPPARVAFILNVVRIIGYVMEAVTGSPNPLPADAGFVQVFLSAAPGLYSLYSDLQKQPVDVGGVLMDIINLMVSLSSPLANYMTTHLGDTVATEFVNTTAAAIQDAVPIIKAVVLVLNVVDKWGPYFCDLLGCHICVPITNWPCLDIPAAHNNFVYFVQGGATVDGSPVLISASPNSGPSGLSVNLNGYYFGVAPLTARFGTTNIEVQTASDFVASVLIDTAPLPGPTVAAGTLQVQNRAGVYSNAIPFTQTPGQLIGNIMYDPNAHTGKKGGGGCSVAEVGGSDEGSGPLGLVVLFLPALFILSRKRRA